MRATGWKGSKTLGVRVGRHDAAQHFNRNWGTVEIEIDGRFHSFRLRETFWTTCPEFRGGELKNWRLRNRLAPWPPQETPELALTPLGGNCFRLSAS